MEGWFGDLGIKMGISVFPRNRENFSCHVTAIIDKLLNNYQKCIASLDYVLNNLIRDDINKKKC